MTVPPNRGQRFRLINAGKDDLIFDVGKLKGQWQIKAIFIAAPDDFLAETAKYFPFYTSYVQAAEAKTQPQEKPDAGAESNGSTAAGSGGGSATVKKKR
jgi:hypothetical protein